VVLHFCSDHYVNGAGDVLPHYSSACTGAGYCFYNVTGAGFETD